MLRKLVSDTAFSWLLALGLLIAPPVSAEEKAASPAPPPAKPTMAKICANCHQPEPGNLRGSFDNVSYKTQSIQIRIDDSVEILRFDTNALKVINVKPDPANPAEPLRMIKKGKEVRVEYIEKSGRKVATVVVSKPPLKVAPEKLMSTADMEKLVALGPEKGKYLLVDCRPALRFSEGALPTAINIPYPAFDKNIDKLPKDKNALLIYYCSGVT